MTATVELLLNFDGDDGSTTFTDESANGLTVTPGGDTQHDTAQTKFGSASALFDGTGDYLLVSDAAIDPGLNTTNWTIDFWVRFNSLAATNGLFFIGTSTSDDNRIQASVATDGSLRIYAASTSTVYDDTSAAGVFSTGVWYHVAFVAEGSAVAAFVDGVQVCSDTASGAVNPANNLYIGYARTSSAARRMNGWIDGFRFTSDCAHKFYIVPTEAPTTTPLAPEIMTAQEYLEFLWITGSMELRVAQEYLEVLYLEGEGINSPAYESWDYAGAGGMILNGAAVTIPLYDYAIAGSGGLILDGKSDNDGPIEFYRFFFGG